jgi:beta-glucuronidase
MPPGYVDETPDGPRQRLLFDFFNYAGIHRTVWLYTTPRARVRDVTVVTGLSGSTGTVRYDVDTADADDLEVRLTMRDAGGAEVARASGPSGELTVADVYPWQPGEGYLYDLTVELWDRGDAPLDSYSLAVGVRTVEIDGTRFLINGEPFYFRGFGKHEDTVIRGRAHDNVFMVHDFALMDWLGANSFRTSHYPYAEEVLDYADRHGIVVIDETPAVGINSGLAAGVFGAEPFLTFSPDTIGTATQNAHREAIRELVARDKNHPCVVMWSIANEPESITPEARAYFEPLVDETRRLDPTRPVGFANVQGSKPDVDVITDMFDVVMLNRYYGWYADSGDLPAAERALGPPRRPPHAVDRGVPGRAARDVPPRVRPGRGGGRRADVELRRLRHRARHSSRRRQQEGRLHARPPTQGGGSLSPSPLARRPLTSGAAR